MGKHYENLEEAMCKELEMLNKKYASDAGEMSAGDVEKADKLVSRAEVRRDLPRHEGR